ncbi:Fic family protein [Sphaerochaeta sp. PS]|uniref:Fic/DOC family protein n=1 Tax=Sphaerochaeta sp. PS TaxID=3076336 RepID=UPI0028A41C40|nr:Fic family protein [Sphaerochaeta sp. PS]MDT4761882.1 Fic family protein [Sphaerochaeta sp. PS]
MKSGRVQACIDYIKFNQEAEGFELSASEEAYLRELLEGDLSAEELIQALIQAEALSTDHPLPKDVGGFIPRTKSLVNYFAIKDRERLRSIEMKISNIRTAELLSDPVDQPFDFAYLKRIHSHLFGDIYPSAGQIRTVIAAKRTEFCSPEFIESTAEDIFERLHADKYLKDMDREEFINDLAFYMGEVETLHPFRDGNGRTTRLFFYQLAMQAGYDIDWSMVDPDRLLEADISAIDGDYQLLIDVWEEVVI